MHTPQMNRAGLIRMLSYLNHDDLTQRMQIEISPLRCIDILQLLQQAWNRLGLAREDVVNFDKKASHTGIIAPAELIRPLLLMTVRAGDLLSL